MVGQMTSEELKEFMEGETAPVFRDAKLPSQFRFDALPDPGKFSGTDPQADKTGSKILAAAGNWRFVALMSESMLPVPKGWEIYEGGVTEHLFFPPVQMTVMGPKRHIKLVDVVHISFSVREEKGLDDAYTTFAADSKKFPVPGGIVFGNKHNLGHHAGYFFIFAKRSGTVSAMCCSPEPEHPDFCAVALITVGREKWSAVAPVLDAMFQNWCSYTGHIFLPGIKLELPAEECKLFGWYVPTTLPETHS